MAITSVSLLEYASGDVTTTDSDNVLVDRKYITNEIYHASDWTPGNSYDVGDLVHVNGKLYTCTASHEAASAFSTDENAERWERTYPVLHKYAGYASETLNGYVITHNLGTTDLTVQIYRDNRDLGDDDPVWVPVMLYYEFGDGSENPDVLNKIRLYPGNANGDYRVVIVAAK